MTGCSVVLDESCPEIVDVCGISREEFLCQALKLLPEGPLWRDGMCNAREIVLSVASTYYDLWQRMCALRPEIDPCTADVALDEWAQIFAPDCSTLPTDRDELSALVCELFQAAPEGFNNETIIALALASGYIVTDIQQDLDRDFSRKITPTNGFKTGFAMVGVCCPTQVTNRAKVSVNCDPCDDEQAELTPTTVAVSGCENTAAPLSVPGTIASLNQSVGSCIPQAGVAQLCHENAVGGCQIYNYPVDRPDCADAIAGSVSRMDGQVGYYCVPEEACGDGYYPLSNPYTLRVTIDPNSPALIDRICGTPRPGSVSSASGQVGSYCPAEVDICGLSSVVPAHINLKFALEC